MRVLPAFPLVLLLAGALRAADVPGSATGADMREEHRARRASLAALLPPKSLALVLADPGDPGALYAPRPNEDYFWLTGSDEPSGILLLEPPPKEGAPHRETLLLPPRDARAEGWIGPRLYPGPEAEARTGIAATADLREARKEVEKRLKGVEKVFLTRGGPSGRHATDLLGDLLGLGIRKPGKPSKEDKGEKDADPGTPVRVEGTPGRDRPDLADLGGLTARLRLRKSKEETARVRRASELSAEGHRRAMATARAGMAEYEIQAVLEGACRTGGCRRQAYDSIVGSGPNSCVLHYGRNRRLLEDGDLVLVDAGGEFLNYASDVTRTWPVGPRFSEEQGRAYDAVLAAQAAGMAAAKPGATFRDIETACRKVLKEAGLEDGWRHGPCHWVGLNVHDPNGSAPLEPGVVFVVEPGVYFPEKGWGIRIEDTFSMREDGTLECLSAAAPKARAEIEALRAAALAAVPSPPPATPVSAPSSPPAGPR